METDKVRDYPVFTAIIQIFSKKFVFILIADIFFVSDPASVSVRSRQIEILSLRKQAFEMSVQGHIALHDNICSPESIAFIIKKQRLAVAVDLKSLDVSA